jgi:hypothetical protein
VKSTAARESSRFDTPVDETGSGWLNSIRARDGSDRSIELSSRIGLGRPVLMYRLRKKNSRATILRRREAAIARQRKTPTAESRVGVLATSRMWSDASVANGNPLAGPSGRRHWSLVKRI